MLEMKPRDCPETFPLIIHGKYVKGETYERFSCNESGFTHIADLKDLEQTKR